MLVISQWHSKERQVLTSRKSLTGAAHRQTAVQRCGAERQVVLNSSWESFNTSFWRTQSITSQSCKNLVMHVMHYSCMTTKCKICNLRFYGTKLLTWLVEVRTGGVSWLAGGQSGLVETGADGLRWVVETGAVRLSWLTGELSCLVCKQTRLFDAGAIGLSRLVETRAVGRSWPTSKQSGLACKARSLFIPGAVGLSRLVETGAVDEVVVVGVVAAHHTSSPDVAILL